jgi:hypothetical protein
MYTRYWPSGIPREYTLAAYQKVFENLGYVLCNNHNYEPGFTKVAIFLGRDSKPSHAAYQGSDGKWQSKLGQHHDIEHNLLALCGEQYGDVACMLKRKIVSD